MGFKHTRWSNEEFSILKCAVKRCGRGSQLTATNNIQWPLDVLTHSLCRESLSTTGWAEQIDHETVSLSFDEVIEADFLMMSFDEGVEEVLAVAWKDGVSEWVRVPVDFADFLEVEFHNK